jgi:hypothetical protein
VELEPSRAVYEIEERRPPVAAARGNPAGDAASVLRLVPGCETLVRATDVGDLRASLIRMRKGLDSRFAQPLQLLPPLGDEVGLLTHR